MDTKPNDLIKIAAAAKMLAINPATLREWIRRGKLAAWRVGARWRVSRADVEAMVSRFNPADSPAPESLTERRNRDAETDAILRAAGVRR
jgi:excisionase family DNA binding protein